MGPSHHMDINEYMLDRITLKMDEYAYKEKLEYPEFLVDFLHERLVVAKERAEKEGPFNPNFMSIKSPSSVSFYTNVLESLL